MDIKTTFSAILMELNLDSLKLESELEAILNSKEPLANKIKVTKKLLKKITLIEASILKFNSMMTNLNETKE